MKTRMVLLALIAFVPLMAIGRFIQVNDLDKLITDSKLVFVGRVKSVKPSDIKTSLSYPTYDGVTFRWLMTEVEVVEPVKGVKKGDVVHAVMLSIDKRSHSQPMYCPPGMLEPEKGDIFFLCLVATPQTNVFAALSAPYDENLSVFALHRSRSMQNDDRDFTKQWLSKDKQKHFAQVYSLVDEAGEIVPANADKLRKTYAAEIGTLPTTNVIYLQWETYTNPSGWMSDVPKGFIARTNANHK
jgi:hypothetical protein